MSEPHHSNPAVPELNPTTTAATNPTTVNDDRGYALSGRIMLGAIVVLFAVVIVMVLLHIYARWYITRHPTPSSSSNTTPRRRRRRRRTADLHNHNHHLVFYLDDPAVTAPSSDGTNRRLDPSVLKSLPTFTFAPPHTATTTTAAGKEEEEEEEEESVMECAVCLSEFEAGEMGRVLPRCGHSFHVDCIDMWFHSHSTCPLCRSTVTAANANDYDNESNQLEIVVDLSSSESNPQLNPDDSPSPAAAAATNYDHTPTSPSPSPTSAAAGFCPGPSSTPSSVGGRRKGTVDGGGVSVEVPARSASFSFLNPAGMGADESQSPGGSLGFRSPTSRLVYLRRILLSREKRPAVVAAECSPGSGNGYCGGELSEMEEGVVGSRSPTVTAVCTGTTVPVPAPAVS